MRPLLQPGDWIGIEWIDADQTPPKRGELGFFRGQGGEWVVHRVIGLTAGTPAAIFMKGDAAFVAEAIPASELWGRVSRWRKHSDGPDHPLGRPGTVDHLIVALSRRNRSPEGVFSRISRKALYALALFRRAQTAAKPER